MNIKVLVKNTEEYDIRSFEVVNIMHLTEHGYVNSFMVTFRSKDPIIIFNPDYVQL